MPVLGTSRGSGPRSCARQAQRPCQCHSVQTGGRVVAGVLALCFFVPARLLEAGGFDDQLQPLPCPALPAVPTGWVLAWLDGWAGWLDGLNGRVHVGSTQGQEWSPAQSTAVSHLIRQNAGWDWKRAWVKTKRPARHMHDLPCAVYTRTAPQGNTHLSALWGALWRRAHNGLVLGQVPLQPASTCLGRIYLRASCHGAVSPGTPSLLPRAPQVGTRACWI